MKLQIKQYGDDNALSAEMMIVAEIFATPGRAGMTVEAIADQVGTSARTITRWRRDPLFVDYVRRRTMENVMEALPDVLDTLTEKAKSGSSIKAIEVWARIAGLYSPEMIVRPMQPEDDRSTSALEASIERLSTELRTMGINIDEEETK